MVIYAEKVRVQMRIQLNVYAANGANGKNHHATRFDPENGQHCFPPELVFSITEEVMTEADIKVLEEHARQEARKHGIASVTNLD